jgi:hypothetical protein
MRYKCVLKKHRRRRGGEAVTGATLNSLCHLRQAFMLVCSISCLTFFFFSWRVLLVEPSTMRAVSHLSDLSLCVRLISLCVRLICRWLRLISRWLRLLASTLAVNRFSFSHVLAFSGFCLSGAGSAADVMMMPSDVHAHTRAPHVCVCLCVCVCVCVSSRCG